MDKVDAERSATRSAIAQQKERLSRLLAVEAQLHALRTELAHWQAQGAADQVSPPLPSSHLHSNLLITSAPPPSVSTMAKQGPDGVDPYMS